MITVVADTIFGSPGGPLSVELWQMSGGTTLLATSTGANLPGGLSNGDFITLNVTNTPLTSGTTYAFLLYFDTAGSNRELDVSRIAGNPYGAGNVVLRTFGASRSIVAPVAEGTAGRDLVFYIQAE